MKDITNIQWTLIMATLVMFISYMILIPQPEPQSKPTLEPKPVYFQPAGRPDSIPCSSEINEKCMIYTPLNTFSQESETENNVH